VKAHIKEMPEEVHTDTAVTEMNTLIKYKMRSPMRMSNIFQLLLLLWLFEVSF